jgi:hypothetical protein
MAIRFSVPLQASVEQHERLAQLQSTFAQACNSLAPLVRETRCWNRVGLHHLAYRNLRERFPQLGSQMACNAIYSVSRACRLVYQSPQSPWSVTRNSDSDLPLVLFEKSAPVYFDRHTLSLRNGAVSMFTLDGRIRFEVNLSTTQLNHFINDRLREVVLQRIGGTFQLGFYFAAVDADEPQTAQSSQLPEYLVVKPWEAGGMSDIDTPVRHSPNKRLTGVER